MFYLSACANCFLFRMPFPLPSTSRLFPLSFLSGSLYLFLCISLYSIWRWVLYMVVSMGLCGFLHMFSSALNSTLLKMLGFFYSMCISCLFIKIQMSKDLWIYIWIYILFQADWSSCMLYANIMFPNRN